MHRWLAPLLLTAVLVACSGGSAVEFWRPISEPNLLMQTDKLQRKLDFDLSQCKCGIYPDNMTHTDVIEFQPDKQRMAETGADMKVPDEKGQCMEQPSLVVSECMRGRGWEVTNCSGRMPLPGGGSLCASYNVNN